jgi:hypothetical protein
MHPMDSLYVVNHSRLSEWRKEERLGWQLKSHAFFTDKKRPQEQDLLDCGSREEE